MYVKLKPNKRMYLMGDNDEVVTTSEQYATDWNAKRAARKAFPSLKRLDKNGVEF